MQLILKLQKQFLLMYNQYSVKIETLEARFLIHGNAEAFFKQIKIIDQERLILGKNYILGGIDWYKYSGAT